MSTWMNIPSNRHLFKAYNVILRQFYSASSQPNVIIVGAGIAGLTAAQILYQNKYQNVKILEAANCSGGRIRTEKFGDALCYLGAKENDKNILVRDQSITFHGSTGKLSSSPVSTAVMIYFRKLKQDMLKDAVVNEENLNLHDCLVDRMKQVLGSFPKNTRSEAVSVFYGLLSNLRLNFGSDLRNVNALLGAKKLKEINDHFEVTANYGPSINEILKSLPINWLQLGTPISKIQWKVQDRSKKISVHSLKGDKYVADFVICTVPLGALQTLSDVMFDPPLYPSRTEPLKSIGVGRLEKIFVQFEKPVGSWFVGPIYCAWDRQELLDRKEWFSGICSIKNVLKSKHVLEVIVAGSQAEDMALVSTDAQIQSDITMVLKKFLDNQSIPQPTQILRTNWSKDTKFLGSISYPTVKTTVDHLSIVKSPIDLVHPRLLFAGEAMIPEYLGTAFGARLSGIREADRIIQYVKRNTL